MFGIGMPELLIIGFIVLVIFGAGKLPKVMGSLGQGLRDFKEGIKFQPEDSTKNLKEGGPEE
jgi:sec-independent protein translocase protein TatA